MRHNAGSLVASVLAQSCKRMPVVPPATVAGRRWSTTVFHSGEVPYAVNADTGDVLYSVDAARQTATITLNRPTRLNAICDETGPLLRECVRKANADDAVKVIVLRGAGDRGFCSGYDLELYAERRRADNPGFQITDAQTVWDPLKDYKFMSENTACFMSLCHSMKPSIAVVHGPAGAVGGGSDIALCCDLVAMEEQSVIGYPPSRLWGCPTTMMWVHRLGMEQSKRLLLTGAVVRGDEAKRIGLVSVTAPTRDALNTEVDNIVARMASVPLNQLAMQKMVVNQHFLGAAGSGFSGSAIPTTQMLATLMDGVARHTPEGVEFKRKCEDVGWKQAVRERDAPNKP